MWIWTRIRTGLLRPNRFSAGFSAMSSRAKKDPSVVAAYARVSRVGGRAGDGFISFDDQEDGIRWHARELGLTIPDDA